MKDDLISRQAIMKEFANFVRASNNSDFARTPTWNDAVSLVESMPPAQPEVDCQKCIFRGFAGFKQFQTAQPEKWIPVSERLPRTDEEVLVYLWGDVPHLAWIDKEGQWETDHFYLDESDLPKAWMPLPESWKGERE